MNQVSLLIVNYNTGSLLSRAVKSALKLADTEVIVVDNASTDSSLAPLPASPRLTLITNSSNQGFARAVNQAAKRARGDYLLLLNPDAVLSPAALRRLLTTARNNPQAIIAPRLTNPDGSSQPSCFRPQTIGNALKEYWLGQKGSYSKYFPKNKNPRPVHCAAAACWLVPRLVWDQLGGFDEKYFLYFEDLDLCDRAGSAGISVVYDPQAQVKHAHGASSRTNPATLKLFTRSALTYHGRLKKLLIDLVALSPRLFTPPISPKKLLILLLFWTGLVLAVASVGYFFLPARQFPHPLVPGFYHANFLLYSWANFDGAHYLSIAGDGYQTVEGQAQYAFFPLFPLLINLLSRTGLDLYTAAQLITTASLVGFVLVIPLWAKRFTKNPLIVLTLTLFSPGAVFLLSIYTEPLFLFLTALTFLLAEKGQWGRAALTTALASATRVNGVFLVLFLLLKSRSHKALLGLGGLAAYMSFLALTTGDPLAWYHAQAGWGKDQPTAPWLTLLAYTRALTTEFVPDLTHLVVAIEVALTVLLLYLLLKFWQSRRFDSSYKWYAAASLALPLITGSLGSMPRFSLTLFPLFTIIPSLPPRIRLVHYLLFALLFIIGIILFTRGYWYA